MDVKAISAAIALYMPEAAAIAFVRQRLGLTTEAEVREFLFLRWRAGELRHRAPGGYSGGIEYNRADLMELCARVEAARAAELPATACPSTAPAGRPTTKPTKRQPLATGDAFAALDRWLETYSGKRTQTAIVEAASKEFRGRIIRDMIRYWTQKRELVLVVGRPAK